MPVYLSLMALQFPNASSASEETGQEYKHDAIVPALCKTHSQLISEAPVALSWPPTLAPWDQHTAARVHAVRSPSPHTRPPASLLPRGMPVGTMRCLSALDFCSTILRQGSVQYRTVHQDTYNIYRGVV